jgi:hypothetical protein
MEDLKRQFQEETKLSFDDIPINGVHLEYINWLEKRIEALSLGDVVGQSEQLFLFYKELQKAGRLYNDNLSDDIMKREAEWFVKKK